MTAWRTALRTEWMNPDPSSVVPSQSSGSPMLPPLSAVATRHLPPETNQALKGKPETGINASVICPQPIIRLPYGAPFEFCLGSDQLSLRASGVCPVSPCPRANMPPPEPPAPATKKPATLVTGR